MLDNDGTDIARRADRREGDKERMVALLPRHRRALADAVLALGLADAPHLRGARFAAHRHRRVGDARGIGGAALLVDDGVHAVQHQREPARVDAEFGEGRRPDIAARREAALRAEQARHDGPAGDEAGRHRRQLYRRPGD